MPSLSELLAGQRMVQSVPNAFDYAGQQLQYQQAEENYAANRRLRDMFAQGMPSAQDIYSVSPEFGMKWSQAQMEQAEKMLGMQEKRGQIQKLAQEGNLSKEKAFAEATGPAADQYYDDINSGMPPEQALAKFRQGFAAGISRLDAMGMSPDAEIDVANLNPEQVLGVATGKGYKSRYFERQQKEQEMKTAHGYRTEEAQEKEEMGRETEAYKRQLPPAPLAEQVYPTPRMTPQGPMVQPPTIPQAGTGQPFQVVEAEPEGQPQPIKQSDVDNLRRMYQQAKGPEKKRLERMLADAVKQQIRRPSEGFVTPESAQKMRIAEKEAETRAEAQAKAEVGQFQEKKQKAELLASLPKVPKLNDLIDKSMSGRIEEASKGLLLGEMAGIPTEALTATKELQIVANQMRSITKALVGVGAVSDFEQRMLSEAAGNIADAHVPAKTRKRQLAMFNQIIRKSLMKSPELAKTLNESEDDSVEAEPEEAPSVKRGSKPKIGQVESGYVFKGGDPSNPASWEKQ